MCQPDKMCPCTTVQTATTSINNSSCPQVQVTNITSCNSSTTGVIDVSSSNITPMNTSMKYAITTTSTSDFRYNHHQ